jgi:hypothetical protein
MKVEEHNRLIEILITVCGIFFIYKAFGSLEF